MSDSFQQFTLSIQQSALSLKEILTAKQLSQALSSTYHPIFQYIIQNNIMAELLEWCFSTKHINDDRFTQYSNAALSIFLAAISKNSRFLSNQTIQDFLLNFLKSEDSLNDHLMGYFSSLFLPSKFDKINHFQNFVEFFTKDEEFPSILIARIKSLAMQELIIEFVSSGQYNSQSLLILNQLRLIISDSDSACHTLCSIYKQLSKECTLYSEISNQKFLNSLIDASTSTTSPILNSPFAQYELATTISDLLYLYPSLIQLLSEEQISILKLTPENITTLSIQCIDAFYRSNTEAFKFFFLDERIHNRLMQRFQLISDDQLFLIAQIPDFVNNLIDMHEKGKWCPHCLKIAIEFGSMKFKCDQLLDKRWRDFFDKNISNKLNILNTEYGGPLPQVSEEHQIDFLKMYRDPFSKLSPSIRLPLKTDLKRLPFSYELNRSPFSNELRRPKASFNKNSISSSIYSPPSKDTEFELEIDFDDDLGPEFDVGDNDIGLEYSLDENDDSEEYLIDI